MFLTRYEKLLVMKTIPPTSRHRKFLVINLLQKVTRYELLFFCSLINQNCFKKLQPNNR